MADLPRGEAQVQVMTEAARTDQGAVRVVRLHVVDNGPGFPDKVLKRAFEPYVTTKTKGTGLGLAVVKKIADEHGARVRLQNRVQAVDGSVSDTGIRGAQVSLSFSKFAPSDAHTAASAADAAPAH